MFWKYAVNLQENMPKCYLWDFIEITLRHGCFPVNLLHIFRTAFLKNTSEFLLPNVNYRSSANVIFTISRSSMPLHWVNLSEFGHSTFFIQHYFLFIGSRSFSELIFLNYIFKWKIKIKKLHTRNGGNKSFVTVDLLQIYQNHFFIKTNILILDASNENFIFFN